MASQYLIASPVTKIFTDPKQFKSIFFGEIYIGNIDEDPLNPSQQQQIYVVDENNVKTPVSQPVPIGPGGYAEYNGNPAKFVCDNPYSIVILDKSGVEKWREPDIRSIDLLNVKHNDIEGRGDIGAHSRYSENTTVSEIESGAFTTSVIPYGTRLIVNDRYDGVFLFTEGGTPNGTDVINAGNGDTATLKHNGAVNVLELGANGTAADTAVFERAAEMSNIVIAPSFSGYDVNLSGNIGSGVTTIFQGDPKSQLIGTSTPQDLNAIGQNMGAYTGTLFSPELRDKNIEVVAGTIRQQQPRSVAGITRPAATTAIINEVDHGREVGDYVVIQGSTPTGYNGTHEILHVDDANNYRVIVDSGLATPATGSITVFGADVWEWIKDSTHEPIGVDDSKPVRSDSSGYGLLIPFSKSYTNVLTMIVNPDETLAGAQGMVIGASVSLNALAIRASLNKTVAGRVYYDGSNWRVSMGIDQGSIYTYNAPNPFGDISYSGGNLSLSHSFCLGSDVSLTPSSTSGVIPYIPSLKVISDSEATINFVHVNPSTHELDLYTGNPNTSLSFNFNKNSNRLIKFDGSDRSSEAKMYFGNIWFFGIMQV